MTSSPIFIILCFFTITFLQNQNTRGFPQIFHKETILNDFCIHRFYDKNVRASNKIWIVNSPNEDFVIYYSLCPSLSSLEVMCKDKVLCLVRQKSEIINLGNKLVPNVESADPILQSISDVKCSLSPNQNYTLTINLQCTNSVKTGARLISHDDCHYEIDMMSPDCEPKCTVLVDNSYLLDLRTFPKNLQVISDNRTFHITPCGPPSPTACGARDISACEIGDNAQPYPLVQADSRTVNYDSRHNALTIRGRFKQGRSIRNVEVLLKCNWSTDMANLKYVKVRPQGRRYRFQVDTSFGCIKLPQSCTAQGLDNLRYSLSRLNRPQGWVVRNVGTGKQITLNICGQLLPTSQNLCSVQQSQVCEVTGDNFVNKGSSLMPLHVDGDVIKAVFKDGSVCDENTNYMTEIDLSCSKIENGPIFNRSDNCTTYITWETPEACPLEYYEGDDCRVSDILNSRSLQKIKSNQDTIHSLTPNSYISYNLCGDLNTSCGGFNNVSFCIRQLHGEDFVLGWENTHLISDHTNLKLISEGNLCGDGRNRGKMQVDFVCHYGTPPPPPQIIVVQDNCQYRMTVFTPLACSGHSQFPKCSIEKDHKLFNLSPLTQKNRNYIIYDKNGRRFSLNVCGPIITDINTKCKGNTMICLYDNKQANIKHQYTSIGGVASPQLYNNTLMIETTIGDYCGGYGHYKTRMIFECDENDNGSLPRFESKENCVYRFIWRTKHACPKDALLISDPDTHAVLDLRTIEKHRLNIKRKNEMIYKFDLSKNHYTVCFKESRCINEEVKKQYNDLKKTITLNLSNDCLSQSEDDDFNKIVFNLECEKISNNEYFLQKTIENCLLNIVLKTASVCLENNTNVYEHIVENSQQIQKLTTTSLPIPPKTKQLYNCVIHNQYTAYSFELSKIPSFNNTRNVINFDAKSSNCEGIWCRDDWKILSFEQKCPKILYNYTNLVVHLQFTSDHYKCGLNGNYNLEILLKCSSSGIDEMSMKFLQDDPCYLMVQLDLPEACVLLNTQVQTNNLTKTTIALTTSSVLLIIIILVGGSFALFKKYGFTCCKRRPYQNIRSKSSVPIYFRDSTQ